MHWVVQLDPTSRQCHTNPKRRRGVRMPEVTTLSVWHWIVCGWICDWRWDKSGACVRWCWLVCMWLLLLQDRHKRLNRSERVESFKANHCMIWWSVCVHVSVCVCVRMRRQVWREAGGGTSGIVIQHNDSICKQCEPHWNVSFWTHFPSADYFAIFSRAITQITAKFSVLHSVLSLSCFSWFVSFMKHSVLDLAMDSLVFQL